MRSIYDEDKKPANITTALLSLPEEREFTQLYERMQNMSADALPIKIALLSAQLVLLFRALTRIYHHVQKASRP